MTIATTPLPLITGERAVVVMFIGCLLYSLPHSLLYPGIFLAFLSLFAVVVEIRSESSGSLSHFQTRPGASSGILLGAVTLPALMLSKLIQLSRALDSHETELGEVDYLQTQYWATSVSCLCVLIFLSLTARSAPKSSHSYRRGLAANFILGCIVLCAAFCNIFTTGMQTTSNLLWVLFHGVATVYLIQHVLKTFPSCASMGETLLVTAGLVLYFGDVLACTVAKLLGYWSSPALAFVQYGIRRNEISIVIQGLLLGLLLFPVTFKFLLHAIDSLPGMLSSGTMTHNGRRSLIFFVSLGFVMIIIMPLWMQFVWDFQTHPFLWYCSLTFALFVAFCYIICLGFSDTPVLVVSFI